MKRALLLLAGTLLVSTACSQGGEPPAKAAQDPAKAAQDPERPAQNPLEQMLAQFREAGIQLDAKAGTVAIPVVVNGPPDPLEYLLIHRRGKKHEALFVTEAKPSVLNGALIALGLEPGRNAETKEKDPLPTPEEIEAGAEWITVTPPEGKLLYMSVRWKDEAGQEHRALVDDLVRDLTTGITMRDSQWIYLGGRMAPLYRGDPPVFVADFEGNLISICYLHPSNHLATMRHERARDDHNWWMTDLCPPPGTECTFVFHKNKPEKLIAQRLALLKKEAAAQKEREKQEKKDGDK